MDAPTMYEKCLLCHLFVVNEGGEVFHLHRGDERDTALDESHPATLSGYIATLITWKVFGPNAMRERFVNLP